MIICLNGVVPIPKLDAKPNPNLNSNPNSMPISFGQMTLRSSELSHYHAPKNVPLDI